MKKNLLLVILFSVYLTAEAKTENQIENCLKKQLIKKNYLTQSKQSYLLYPMVTLNLSCGSFTTLPTSPLGAVILDMAACCPSSLAVLLRDFDCWLCNNGCPLPPEAGYA